MLAEIANPPVPSPLPSALREVMRGDSRVGSEPAPHLRDDLRLRLLALVERQRLTQEVDVRRRAGYTRDPDGRLDLRDPFNAAQFLYQLKRDVRRAVERRALGRVEVNRPFPHVLVRHELAADHPVQREGEQRRHDRDRNDGGRVVERPVHLPRVPPVEPVKEAVLLRLLIGCGVRQLEEPRAQHRRQREATSIDTRIAKAIVQPTG